MVGGVAIQVGEQQQHQPLCLFAAWRWIISPDCGRKDPFLDRNEGEKNNGRQKERKKEGEKERMKEGRSEEREDNNNIENY